MATVNLTGDDEIVVLDTALNPDAHWSGADRGFASDMGFLSTSADTMDDTPLTVTVRNPFISVHITSDDNPLVT